MMSIMLVSKESSKYIVEIPWQRQTEVTLDEFIDGIMRCKGAARQGRFFLHRFGAMRHMVVSQD